MSFGRARFGSGEYLHLDPANLEEIGEQLVPILGRDALRMELHPVDRQRLVAEAHHAGAVEPGRLAGGVDDQAAGNVLDDQRVIAGRVERAGQSLEQPGAVVVDRTGLAMTPSFTTAVLSTMQLSTEPSGAK